MYNIKIKNAIRSSSQKGIRSKKWEGIILKKL